MLSYIYLHWQLNVVQEYFLIKMCNERLFVFSFTLCDCLSLVAHKPGMQVWIMIAILNLVSLNPNPELYM